MSLRRSQEAAEAGRDEFATVSQRVLREVDRFKRETTEDMRRTVLEYIQLQVEYNKKMEQTWAALIPQLERVQLDPNANVVAPADHNESANDSQRNSLTSSPPQQPQIHSQPMVPNPQQAMQQAPVHHLSNPFFGGQSLAPHDPNMLSVQYRETPNGAF